MNKMCASKNSIYGHIFKAVQPIFIKLVAKCLFLQTISFEMEEDLCERFPLRLTARRGKITLSHKIVMDV